MKANQTTSMMMIATLVGALLLFMAPPAAAEDVNECMTSPEDTGVEACIVDTTDGDKDTACQGADGEGSYEGETSVSAEVDTEAGGGAAEVGGTEDCSNSSFQRNQDEVAADAYICVAPEHGTIHGNCYQDIASGVSWGQEDVWCCGGGSFHSHGIKSYTFVRNQDTGFSMVTVEAVEEFSGECIISVTPLTDTPAEGVEEPCPADTTPPTPPNPGWGNVTP